MVFPRSVEGAPQAPVLSTGSDEGNSGHIPISLGYQAAANIALLEMQENYVLINQLQREAAILALKDQQGDGKNGTSLGTVMAMANAIQNSANADAEKTYFDAGNEGAQALGSGLTMGITAKAGGNQQAMNEANQDLNNAKEFETSFNAAGGASRSIGDEPLEPMTSGQKARYDDIVEGRSTQLNKDGSDGEIFKHVKANGDAGKVTARLNQAKLEATNRMNEIQTGRQATIQFWQQAVGFGQHAISTGLTAKKGFIDATEKGPADAERTVAQASDQNVSQVASQSMDQAKTSSDAADALNRAREAIAANSATARG